MDRDLITFETKIEFFQNASLSEETKRAIKKTWEKFQEWCRMNRKEPFPCEPTTLEAYLVHLFESGVSNSTLEQVNWAIGWLHVRNELPLPTQNASLKRTLLGIKRLNVRKLKKRKSLEITDIQKMRFPPNIIGLRDRLVLLLGFVGGMRRSEIATLEIENIEKNERGLRLELLRSKTNQYGKDEEIAIPFSKDAALCAVQACEDWLKKTGLKKGRLIRSFNKDGTMNNSISAVSVGQIVKKYAESLGLNPEDYCGHSLRAGCATHLLKKKVPINIVAKHLRHKKIETTLAYDRNEVMDQIADSF